jgi:hypothetical protein
MGALEDVLLDGTQSRFATMHNRLRPVSWGVRSLENDPGDAAVADPAMVNENQVEHGNKKRRRGDCVAAAKRRRRHIATPLAAFAF